MEVLISTLKELPNMSKIDRKGPRPYTSLLNFRTLETKKKKIHKPFRK